MKLILAADENWGIGKNGDLLCHISGDLKYFKEKTQGKTVVMGRKTLESLPGSKPLPKRRNIVMSGRDGYEVEGAEVVSSMEELNHTIENESTDNVMIIGGAKIYEEFLPFCDTCFITKIYKKFDADAFFCNLDNDDDFEIVWKSGINEENGIKYEFFQYERKKK